MLVGSGIRAVAGQAARPGGWGKVPARRDAPVFWPLLQPALYQLRLMRPRAGYDHLELARAISAYSVDVQERYGGRDDPRLLPVLACLIELLHWLKQWHNDPDPEYQRQRMGDYFERFIQDEARGMGKTVDEIKPWTPPARASGARRR
jgi:hypothetical protein